MKVLRGKEHDDMCKIILFALRNDNTICKKDIEGITKNARELTRECVHKYNILTVVTPGTYVLNLDVVKRICYVVPDDLWENLADKDFRRQLREQIDGKKRKKPRDPEKLREQRRKRVLVRQANRVPVEISDDPLDTTNILFPQEMAKTHNNKGEPLRGRKQ